MYNTYICFDEEYIKFTNLISLEIREVNLDYIFEKKKFDFNSFPKLQELIIGISSVIDYIFLIKLLKSLKYLKELTIFNNSILLDEEYEYAHYFNKYASNIIPDETIYKEAFDKQSEILGNTIIELKNLETLQIYDFKDINPFINIILEKYQNNNLKQFDSNCIELSSAKTFLENNKKLNYINLFN